MWKKTRVSDSKQQQIKPLYLSKTNTVISIFTFYPSIPFFKKHTFILLIPSSSQSKKCKIKPHVTNWNLVCILTLTSSIKSHYRHKGTEDFAKGCTVCGSTRTQWNAAQFNINPPQGPRCCSTRKQEIEISVYKYGQEILVLIVLKI